MRTCTIRPEGWYIVPIMCGTESAQIPFHEVWVIIKFLMVQNIFVGRHLMCIRLSMTSPVDHGTLTTPSLMNMNMNIDVNTHTTYLLYINLMTIHGCQIRKL